MAMTLHELHPAGLLVAAIGLTVWRARHRPSVASTLLAFGACAAAGYTAYLGGELVYALGVGVKAMPAGAVRGASDGTPLLSRAAPARLARDAGRGAAWLAREAIALFSGKETLREGALAP